MLQDIQILQQLGFYGGVSNHGESQLPLWPGQATGALDQLVAQCADLLDVPQRRTFFARVAFLLIAEHLHLPVVFMRQHSREQVDLVAGLFASGDAVHLCLRLEFGEDTFLSTTSIVEGQRLLGRDPFVGDEHLEVVAIFVGYEQVQLDRTFVLLAIFGSHEDKAVPVIPARGFPVCLEETPRFA